MKFAFLVLFLISFRLSYGQDVGSQKLKVFLDCKEAPCDDNFIRTEITLVDFVLYEYLEAKKVLENFLNERSI